MGSGRIKRGEMRKKAIGDGGRQGWSVVEWKPIGGMRGTGG